MNERVKYLRDQSLNAINCLSHERAKLITDFYKSEKALLDSIPVQRAKAFYYILEHKAINIQAGEIIVGERGPAPKATSTYPEICLHSLEDLDILNNRQKVSFKVSEETKKLYETEIIPFWKGKTIRDKNFAALPQEWIEAYKAGFFTEFQEQRAPGHTVAGDKIYKKGMKDIKNDIKNSLDNLDFYNDKNAYEKREELKAMDIVADAIIMFAQRHAEELLKLSEIETDTNRKYELLEMAKVCRKVPAHAPETFHEALQYYWFVHVGVITELNPWDSFNPGRLDRNLFPFYKNDIENNRLTKDKAIELLHLFWIKFNNHPSPPKIGITAKESNTYTDFALINVGGVNTDGSDATNELTYIILDVIEEMRILQPSSMVQLSKKNPDRLMKRAAKIVKTGFGQPSIFNTDAIIQELVYQGKTIEDARNGGASGCVEAGAFGTEAYILTGYFNLTKILELTLNNGFDKGSGMCHGLKTGNPADFKSFEELLNAFQKQLQHFVNLKILGNNIIDKVFENYMPAPFLSLIIDDCVKNGVDYNCGGARYNTSYIQGVGLGTITDSLTAIKFHVFDNLNITFSDFLNALNVDFDGYEDFRYDLIYNTPKYGNDDDYADNQAVTIFNMFYNAVNGRPTVRGGTFRINMLPTTSHVYFGTKIGATPDGRKAKQPLSEGISPVQGADVNGPTSVIRSASKIDQLKTGGTLLNQKFTPNFLATDEGLNNLVYLVRSYFRLDGHHIQFNVVSAETLADAKKHPENYRDLIVRVAGYSDYFNDLTEELQDEIIRRTEHETCCTTC